MSNEPVLVFDGVCVLCSRSVQFVLRHDRQRRYRFATTQSTSGAAIMRGHGLDPEQPLSVLLIEGECSYTESAAMLHVLEHFGGGWKALSIALRIVPRGVRDPIYRWIARHRYRWFGLTDTCYLPQFEDADRFLP